MYHLEKQKSNKANLTIHIPGKGFKRKTYNSQNINPIYLTPKFTMGIMQIKAKSLSSSVQWLVQ